MELFATATATATACGKAFQVIFKPCNILYISFYSPRMVAQFAETYTLSGKQLRRFLAYLIFQPGRPKAHTFGKYPGSIFHFH